MIDSISITEVQPGEAERIRWQRLIDGRLLAWLSDPSQLADDGIDAPERGIIRHALDIAEYLRNEGNPAPEKVVPDPNGGMVFEWRDGGITETIYVWDDYEVEYMRFVDSRLDVREKFWPKRRATLSYALNEG